MTERRIGAYGGTFDPIHNGHVEIARAVARNFKLDELLIIPAHRPPHKDPRSISNACHRFAMAVLATLDDERVIVSTVEIEAPANPYTFETIGTLRDVYGSRAKLFFVIGADSFEDLGTWREPERLLTSANWVVASRPGHGIAASHMPARFRPSVIDLRGQNEVITDSEEQCCHVYLTDYVSRDLSSREIRQRAREGQDFRDMVPARVADYIEKYQLYRR